MMDFLVTNFELFAEVYMRCLIVLYIIGMAVLCAFWLKPFTQNHKAAYLTAVTYLVFRFIYYLVPIDNDFLRILALGIIIISFLTVWLIDKKRNPIQKLFLCILFYLMSWLTYEISVEIGLFEDDLISKFEWYYASVNMIVIEFFIWNLIDYALAIVTMIITMRVLQKAYKRKFEELTWKEFLMLLTPFWTFLIVKPIMLAYFKLWMAGIENGTIKENIPSSLYRTIFCILSILSILIIITLYEKIKESKEDDFSRKALENKIEDTHRHVEKIEEMYNQMRAMRHDMGNHMAVLEGLIDNNEKAAASEYIGCWKKNFEEISTQVKTGNAITDVAISEYADKFRKENISFDSSFVYPEHLQINPFELCIIVSNALQNAFEASKNVENPQVSLTSISRNNTYIINVKNRTDAEVFVDPGEGLPYSSKKEDGHGYGLKNIKNIAEKYKGTLEIRQEKDDKGYMFVLNIMLIG